MTAFGQKRPVERHLQSVVLMISLDLIENTIDAQYFSWQPITNFSSRAVRKCSRRFFQLFLNRQAQLVASLSNGDDLATNSVMNFLAELKRRNVIRGGSLYLVAAWLVLQVADVLFDALELPGSAMRLLLGILVLGFPVALIFAWFYQLTSVGLKHDSEVQPGESISAVTARRLNILLAALLVIAVGFLVATRLLPGSPTPADAQFEDLSIAVLPFANRSANADDVYFVDGMHDDILTQLARIDALIVTSRTSVERFRDTSLSILEIGEKLGVRHVLEGGIQRSGNRVRINMQLINTQNDDHVWAETFDRELTANNLFEVQGEIALAVAKTLEAALQGEERAALNERPTESTEAYDLYLLGRYHLKQRTAESITLAKVYFEQAAEEDPNYVPALSGLADSYTLLVYYGNLPGEDAFPKAELAINRAMAIDDSVSEVWASLGLLETSRLHPREAENALRRAIELDPKNFSAWLWYGRALIDQRQWVDAIDAYEAAYALEPMSKTTNGNLATELWRTGDFARSRQHLQRYAELAPENAAWAEKQIADRFRDEGRLATAVQRYRQKLAKSPSDPATLRALAGTHVLLGNLDKAKVWYEHAERLDPFSSEKVALFKASKDFDGMVVFLQDLLERVNPYEALPIVYSLFEASYLGGDIAQAADYLEQLLQFVNGRWEVNPWGVGQLETLLIAEFLIKHGDAYDLDSQHGAELLDEAHTLLADFFQPDSENPLVFTSLAVSYQLRGDALNSLDSLARSVEKGHRDLTFFHRFSIIDDLPETPRLAAIRNQMMALIDAEAELLATLELAPYELAEEREVKAVSRDALRDYAGFYTDGDNRIHAQINNDGSFTLDSHAQASQYTLLAFEDNRFFAAEFPALTVEFVRDDDGVVTHMMQSTPSSQRRYKLSTPPPTPINLAAEVLQKYVGSYSYDRASGPREARADVDIWTAEFIAGEDGRVWLDFDNQPKIEIAFYSETQFYLRGALGQAEFFFENSATIPNGFVIESDGQEMEFIRQ